MTLTETDTEKRQFHRMPETVTITVKKIVYPLTDDDAVQGVEKNISVGGVCFAVPHAYKPGDLLTLPGCEDGG